MSNAVTIYGSVKGYITSTSGTVTNYINANDLSSGEAAQIDGDYPNVTHGVASVAVSSAGSAYTNPVVTFTGGTEESSGGYAAAAYAVLGPSGDIVSIVVTSPGNYSVLPTGATVSDSTGSGATLAAPVATTNLQSFLNASLYAPTGQNAWTHFSGLVQSYNSAGDVVLIQAADQAPLAAAPAEGDFNTLLATVNAIKHVVNANLVRSLQDY